MTTTNQVPVEVTRPLNPNNSVLRPGRHSRPMTATKPQQSKASATKRVLLILLTVVVVLGILATAAYFIKQLIDSKYYFCHRSVRFIPLAKACDGTADCSEGEDEITCVSNFKVNTTFPVRLMTAQKVLQLYGKDGSWMSVCSEDWTAQHTVTACNELGYTSKPSSGAVPVGRLPSALAGGPFVAVRPGATTIYSHQERKVCKSGAVISLTCSDCGLRGATDRVVGGTDAVIEDWPWQVSLQQNGQHTCGGSLVAPRWVVTAAHCFSGTKKEVSRWKVVSGRTYMGTLGGSYVDRIILNADYNPRRNDYDIAMMRLSSPISVGDTRKPACLPPKALGLVSGAPLVVTGWGYLEERGKVSPVLQKADLPLIGRAQCAAPTLYGSSITDRMLCAGFLEGKVDACQGDSGGPLVHLSASHWTLVGVVSWGIGCARERRPGVYCNVDEMLNWIHTVVQKNP